MGLDSTFIDGTGTYAYPDVELKEYRGVRIMRGTVSPAGDRMSYADPDQAPYLVLVR